MVYDDILSSIIERDRVDSERENSPLKPAEDAVQLDCTTSDIDQTVQRILEYVNPEPCP